MYTFLKGVARENKLKTNLIIIDILDSYNFLIKAEIYFNITKMLERDIIYQIKRENYLKIGGPQTDRKTDRDTDKNTERRMAR